MSLTRTTLSADLTADGLTATVASTTGFPTVGASPSPKQMLQVDAEYILIQAVPVSGTVKLMQRGYNGSKAVAHDLLAPVVTSSDPQDFVAVSEGAVGNRAPWVDAVLSVGENGVIPVPNRNTTYLLTKATALASTTFGAPAKDQDGLRVTFTSQTAAAHVITATGLWGDGASGSPEDTATWDAFIGASLTVVADNGIWNIVSAVAVVIT